MALQFMETFICIQFLISKSFVCLWIKIVNFRASRSDFCQYILDCYWEGFFCSGSWIGFFGKKASTGSCFNIKFFVLSFNRKFYTGCLFMKLNFSLMNIVPLFIIYFFNMFRHNVFRIVQFPWFANNTY